MSQTQRFFLRSRHPFFVRTVSCLLTAVSCNWRGLWADGFYPCLSSGSLLRQIYCVVIFLAGGVEAGDEHHFVAVVSLHDLVIDHLNIV